MPRSSQNDCVPLLVRVIPSLGGLSGVGIVARKFQVHQVSTQEPLLKRARPNTPHTRHPRAHTNAAKDTAECQILIRPCATCLRIRLCAFLRQLWHRVCTWDESWSCILGRCAGLLSATSQPQAHEPQQQCSFDESSTPGSWHNRLESGGGELNNSIAAVK